jgi:hypothetical protein
MLRHKPSSSTPGHLRHSVASTLRHPSTAAPPNSIPTWLRILLSRLLSPRVPSNHGSGHAALWQRPRCCWHFILSAPPPPTMLPRDDQSAAALLTSSPQSLRCQLVVTVPRQLQPRVAHRFCNHRFCNNRRRGCHLHSRVALKLSGVRAHFAQDGPTPPIHAAAQCCSASPWHRRFAVHTFLWLTTPSPRRRP